MHGGGLQIPLDEWKTLSYRERRRLINKAKKRIKRVERAKQRKLKEQEFEEYWKSPEGIQEQKLAEQQRHKEEVERQLRHEEWLEKERKVQEEFKLRKEKEDKKLKEREERERMIREEWEEIERREKEATEKRKKGKTSKEAMLEEALADIDHTLDSLNKGGDSEDIFPWHNPLAPPDSIQEEVKSSSRPINNRYPVAPPVTMLEEKEPLKNFGTEKDKVNCPFFFKTGACRYGDTCSRVHATPTTSSTLIIRGMYSNPVLTRQFPDDQDAALEVDETELITDYKEFYNDVYPELAACGKIVQFKVSRNYEPHLRGNVYVQFSSEEECTAAVKAFNGRWYAGKQLSCNHCPIQRWRTAICGLYNREQCPKGRHCNFLHVFDNPGGAFRFEDDNNMRERRTSPGRRRGSDSYQRRQSREDYYRRNSSSPDGSPSWYKEEHYRRTFRDKQRRRRRDESSGSRRRDESPSHRRRHSSPLYSRSQRREERDDRLRDRSYSQSRSPRPSSRRRGYGSSSSPDSNSYRSRKHSNNRRREDSDHSPHPRNRSSSRERKRKKKKKSKSKHKKHKRSKHHKGTTSNSSDGGEMELGDEQTQEAGMKEMMDKVLRQISVDENV